MAQSQRPVSQRSTERLPSTTASSVLLSGPSLEVFERASDFTQIHFRCCSCAALSGLRLAIFTSACSLEMSMCGRRAGCMPPMPTTEPGNPGSRLRTFGGLSFATAHHAEPACCLPELRRPVWCFHRAARGSPVRPRRSRSLPLWFGHRTHAERAWC